MSLENLAAISQLDRITPDTRDLARLLEAAGRSLRDAQLPGLSAEGRFDMAYKAIMQAANAALQANGYRTLTSKPGHHATMIQTLPMTIRLDRSTMVLLDTLRKQRNVVDYSGDMVSESMAAEAVLQAQRLIERVSEWMRVRFPDLSPK